MKTRLALLLILLLAGRAGAQVLMAIPTPAAEQQSATIGTSGDTLTVVFANPVTVGGSDNDRLWLNTAVGHPTLSYASGSGTDTLVYNISRTIYSTETVTLDAESSTIAGLDDFSAMEVTNNSSQTYTPTGTEITAASKAADGIVYLNSASTTYYLGENITSDGPGIAITASNVTLDLNYKTLTYNNATPISITNAGFESGTTGWDFTNAANAEIYTPADAAYGWLNNEIYEGASSLRFTDTTLTEYVDSSSTVSLAANTTYVVSVMFMYGTGQQPTNPGVTGYIQLLDTGTPITGRDPFNVSTTGLTSAAWSSTNTRGIQLIEMMFTTTDAVNVTVRVGITGHASGTLDAHFDDIRIRRMRDYGVTYSIANDTQNYYYPNHDYTTYVGDTTGCTIKNGSIVQGQDAGSQCHAVWMHKTTGVTLDNVSCDVNGNNTGCVRARVQENSDRLATVTNCYFDATDIDAVGSRDNWYGQMVGYIRGDFLGNRLVGGPNAGVRMAALGSEIARNRIACNSRYSNCFGIMAATDGSTTLTDTGLVHDNAIIAKTGLHASHGFFLGGTHATDAYDNYVDVRLLANNQEYSTYATFMGDQQNGVYGFQIEGGSNKHIYSNTIIVGSEFGEAHAARIGGSDTVYANNEVNGNTFYAILGTQDENVPAGKARSSVYRLAYQDGSEGSTIHDNVGYTNSRIVGTSADVLNQVIEGDTYYVTTGATFESVEKYTTNVVGLTFLDPVFGTALAGTSLREDQVVNESGTPVASNTYLIQWTSTIHASTGTSGLSVSIQDKDTNEVDSGTTDGSGNFVSVVTESLHESTGVTNYNNHSAIITGAESGSQTFTADQPQTVNVTVE